MSTTVASMVDAKTYFERLPKELEPYFDEAYQNAFHSIMDAFNEFFNVTEAIDIKANNEHIITPEEATDIGTHGLTLILKMIDLMLKLDLPHKRQEIEQISLIFATWTMQYEGRINFLEPIVNAFAQAANSLNSKDSLFALSEIMSEVVLACSDEIKQDFDSANLYRPWRLLLINRGIVATRSNDANLMIAAFDDLIRYLPQDAPGFFEEGFAEMEEKNYPERVKQLLVDYNKTLTKLRLH